MSSKIRNRHSTTSLWRVGDVIVDIINAMLHLKYLVNSFTRGCRFLNKLHIVGTTS